MLTIEDIRNPLRKSGFDHVSYGTYQDGNGKGRSGGKPYRATLKCGVNSRGSSGVLEKGPRRDTAEEAAQDYCDYINGVLGTPVARQLRSAGHNGQRARRAVDDEDYEAALGYIRDVQAQREGRQGFIYCISDGEYVKVGYSTNPQARVRELQTGNARPLRLLWFFAGTKREEAELHQKHIKSNVLQEWFRPSVELALDFYNRKADANK